MQNNAEDLQSKLNAIHAQSAARKLESDQPKDIGIGSYVRILQANYANVDHMEKVKITAESKKGWWICQSVDRTNVITMLPKHEQGWGWEIDFGQFELRAGSWLQNKR